MYEMSETEIKLLQSYPPNFINPNTPLLPITTTQPNKQHETVLQQQEESAIDHGLPVIDLENLSLENLREACKNWGLFRIVNHGIPLTLLNQLQDQAKVVFSEPFDWKKSAISNPLSYFWGSPALTPSGAALSGTPPQKNIDWVEGFNVPLSQLSLFHSVDPSLYSLRFLLEEYGKHVGRIGTTIFQAMLQTLDLNVEKYANYLSESTGFLRVYRYPKSSYKESVWGMKAHTDSSVLSILSQEQVSGLQLLKDDKWLDVHPLPHTLLLNLGDMMQAISDDEYKSVTHRVKANKWQDRHSICYFVFPDDQSVISSSNYKPFTYNDFRDQVQQDIKTSGFKVGLNRFKLAAHRDQAEK